MIGIELVKDEQLTPAAAETEAIKEYCFQNGVLVGVGGVYGNVIRLQPPLIITKQQMDHAIDTIAAAVRRIVPQAVTARR